MSPMTNVLFTFALLLVPSIIAQPLTTQEKWQSNFDYTTAESVIHLGLIPLMKNWQHQSPNDTKSVYEEIIAVAKVCSEIAEVVQKESLSSIAAHGYIILSLRVAYATWHLSEESSKIKAELWKELREEAFKKAQEEIKELKIMVDDMKRVAINFDGSIQMRNEQEVLFDEISMKFKYVHAHLNNTFDALKKKINILMDKESAKHMALGGKFST